MKGRKTTAGLSGMGRGTGEALLSTKEAQD